MDKYFDDFFATIVGINNYGSSSLSTLHSAEKDAKDLYDFLTKTGGYKQENAELLTGSNATKENINQKIEEYKNLITENSTMLFYFSGHGINYNNHFILPLYNFDEKNESTFFTADELIDLFSKINVRKILFLFDTCYAGALTREKGTQEDDNEEFNPNSKFILEKLVETNTENSRVLVASSLPDQTSYEINNKNINNGVFTHCLLKALKGSCQIEKSPRIYVFELLRYLVKNVSAVALKNGINQQCCVKTSVLYQDFPVCYTSEEVDNNTQLPKRYINAVIDLQEDSNTLIEQFADGLSKRTVDSKFTYWGQEVTKQYIELLQTNQYKMRKITSDLLSDNITKIIKKISNESKGIRVISLGIGDGYKDAIILNKICEIVNTPIDYWIIEFSYEMLKIGLKNVQEKLGEVNNRRIDSKLFQTDFLDINILVDLLNDDKINLFLLLGNTLGNFPEDVLLNKISSVMHIGDYFLIDNQIKGENKLTTKEARTLYAMYDTKKYKDYIFSILNNAQIKREDGDIKTQVIPYNPNIDILRKYKCATVVQEFTFKVNKEVTIGGKKIPFNKGTIIPVIYSRKYTKNALIDLLEKYFYTVFPFYHQNQYALILCQKTKVISQN